MTTTSRTVADYYRDLSLNYLDYENGAKPWPTKPETNPEPEPDNTANWTTRHWPLVSRGSSAPGMGLTEAVAHSKDAKGKKHRISELEEEAKAIRDSWRASFGKGQELRIVGPEADLHANEGAGWEYGNPTIQTILLSPDDSAQPTGLPAQERELLEEARYSKACAQAPHLVSDSKFQRSVGAANNEGLNTAYQSYCDDPNEEKLAFLLNTVKMFVLYHYALYWDPQGLVSHAQEQVWRAVPVSTHSDPKPFNGKSKFSSWLTSVIKNYQHNGRRDEAVGPEYIGNGVELDRVKSTRRGKRTVFTDYDNKPPKFEPEPQKGFSV